MSRTIIQAGGFRRAAAKGWQIFRSHGVSGIAGQITALRRRANRNREYPSWISAYDTLDEAAIGVLRQRIAAMEFRPLISILMPVYNPATAYLDAAIRSVTQQLYPNWELCIADDASKDDGIRRLIARHAAADSRIKVVRRSENGNISRASNSALELASAAFVGLLDHDDLLPPQALFHVADAILRHPNAGLIYSDEDKIDDTGIRQDPYFKCDWNPELFRTHNMINHFSVYRTDLVRDAGGFRVGFEGSQDYDLALRVSERLTSDQIVHIPQVLYHWRIHRQSTAGTATAKPYAFVSGEKALNDHLQRLGVGGRIEHLGQGSYRVHYDLPSPLPLVSIIIPTRNSSDLVRSCIGSIMSKTTYAAYEIVLLDNESDDPEALSYFSALAAAGTVKIVPHEGPFNFSAITNHAVEHASGEIICLLNNDTEVISPDWLSEMVSIALQNDVGAVGAKLYYSNDTIQHAGIITGLFDIAGHIYGHFDRRDRGYFGRAALAQNLSAVTGACLAIRKEIFLELGGFDPELAGAYNDVDFCLRLMDRGYRNVWTPYAELYHHESVTRGYETTPDKQSRLKREADLMQARWGKRLQNDPAYSPNLTLEHPDCSYAWPPRTECVFSIERLTDFSLNCCNCEDFLLHRKRQSAANAIQNRHRIATIRLTKPLCSVLA